tara:strand:+ start:9759 stop:10133 length:375 start_codon:yes stop_codon:yes gene_type:complete
MEPQIPASVPPQVPEMPPRLTHEQLEELKRIAKEHAIQQVTGQNTNAETKPAPPPGYKYNENGDLKLIPQPFYSPEQKVVYVKRPLTVAEIIFMLVISCGLVLGGQLLWRGLSEVVPRVEIRMK